MKRNKIATLFCVFTFFAAVLCADGADVKQPVVKTEVTVQQARVLSVTQNTYSYNPAGKPDPFKPLVEPKIIKPLPLKKERKEAETKMESIFPLQKAEADSFNLVGIIGDQSNRLAIVEDSAKKFYPIVVGTQIGRHNGKVSNILADRVIIDELTGKKIKKIVLKLRNN